MSYKIIDHHEVILKLKNIKAESWRAAATVATATAAVACPEEGPSAVEPR